MLLFLVGASGVHIGCCLNPVEGSFLLFRFVWWHQPFAALGDCLKRFLMLRSLWVFAQVSWDESQRVSYFLHTILPLLSLSGPSLRARSAATEEKKGGRLPFE